MFVKQLTLQAAQGTVGLIAAPVQGSVLPLQTPATLVTHVKTEDEKPQISSTPVIQDTFIEIVKWLCFSVCLYYVQLNAASSRTGARVADPADPTSCCWDLRCYVHHVQLFGYNYRWRFGFYKHRYYWWVICLCIWNWVSVKSLKSGSVSLSITSHERHTMQNNQLFKSADTRFSNKLS